MSSFYCEKCGTNIIDTPSGYITGCEHYPLDIECKYLTCGWMCGNIFIRSGVEKWCDPSSSKCCNEVLRNRFRVD